MDNGNLFRQIDVLIEHEVPLVIIGGHAVTAHGYFRTTEDSDILFMRSPDAELRLFAALTELHAHWIGSEIDLATGIERIFPVTIEYVRSNSLMLLVTDHGFLDIFDFVPGIPSTNVRQIFETSVVIAGRRFVSREWLKEMKRAAGRPKDLIDLENLPD